MSVVTFKTGLVSEMFDWQEGGYVYLPSWVSKNIYIFLLILLNIMLIIIPLVTIIIMIRAAMSTCPLG